MNKILRIAIALLVVAVVIGAVAYALRSPEPRRRVRQAVERTPLARREGEPEAPAEPEPTEVELEDLPAEQLESPVSGITAPEPVADDAAPSADETVAQAVDTPEAPPPSVSPIPAQEPAPPAEELREEEEPEEPLPLESEFAEVLEDVPTTPISTLASRNAESYLDEGNVYFNVGQYGLAIERYNQAIDLDANLVAAYYNRANALTRNGAYDQALADYDKALELAPDDADAFNNRGMLYLYRGDYSHALADFDAALNIDPNDSTVIVNRGLAHLHDSRPNDALRDFISAIESDPGDAAAHYGAGQAAAALGNKDDALRHLGRAMSIDPAYTREAAADPRLQSLQGDDAFIRLLRERGGRS